MNNHPRKDAEKREIRYRTLREGKESRKVMKRGSRIDMEEKIMREITNTVRYGRCLQDETKKEVTERAKDYK